MASSGNTWFKKLRAKGKKHGIALSRGTFKSHSLASTWDAPKPIVKVQPSDVPNLASYKPGKLKGGSGCKLNEVTRAEVARRRALRDVMRGGR